MKQTKLFFILFLSLIFANTAEAQQWWEVGTAGFSAGQANYTSIAIDGSGTPFVVYRDDGNSYKATVMSFGNAPLPVELTTFTSQVNGNNVELNWETATEVNNYGFNVERKTIDERRNGVI